MEIKEKVCDIASLEVLNRAEQENIETCFTRTGLQKGICKYGSSGICCRICYMGPCRITAKSPKGICGADADTIVARNYLREVTSGVSAHSDHGRHLLLRLKKVIEGNGNGYELKDKNALRYTARLYKIEENEKSVEDIAQNLVELFLEEFSSQEKSLKTLNLSPLKRQSVWKTKKVLPMGIDRTIVESLHRTNMGVDHDYKNVLIQAFRTSLVDGWGGSRIATIISDILFGTPEPLRGNVNLGVLKKDEVNIVVHGHEPELSEMLALAIMDPEVKEYAKQSGAKGVTLAGICCTANEILMRHGIPIAGSFLQQELAIITGAVEMMVIDVQCCMPSLPEIASRYHTKIVSTSEIAKTTGTIHITFNEDDPMNSAKEIVKTAIDNFKNRDHKNVFIPSKKSPAIAGFSVDAIKYMLGGAFRASFRPLNDAIIQGRIKGIVGIVGCNNPRVKVEEYINTLTKVLIKENVLILKTGCAAIASAKEGMLTPETAIKHAGHGLREVCEAVGIPPILHMGSCVDNSRILEAATEIVLEGGLGDDLSQIPAVGIAPEWMSEKAIAIGTYFVASGIDVILGHPFRIEGSENVSKFLYKEVKDLFGASFHVCEDPKLAAATAIKILDELRDNLGINKKIERKLFDMKDRRELDV